MSLKNKKSLEYLLKRSQKHTGHVRVLRIFLPISALVIILLVLLWSSLELFFEKKIEGIPHGNRNILQHNKVLNPRMTSTDSKGNPYKIQAKTATQTNDSKANFEKPCCEIVGSKGQQIKIQSDNGSLDQETKKFTYDKNVHLETNDGYTFDTKKAEVDLKTQTITGKFPVVGKGPAGEITSQGGFYINKESQELHFIGSTKLVIKQNNKNNKKGH